MCEPSRVSPCQTNGHGFRFASRSNPTDNPFPTAQNPADSAAWRNQSCTAKGRVRLLNKTERQADPQAKTG